MGIESVHVDSYATGKTVSDHAFVVVVFPIELAQSDIKSLSPNLISVYMHRVI